MKKVFPAVIILLLSLAINILIGCEKKKNPKLGPGYIDDPPATTPVVIDSSLAGNYTMIYCSDHSELAGVNFKVNYVSEKKDDSDSTVIIRTYVVRNNTSHPGQVWITKNNIWEQYTTGGTPKMEPTFQETDKIMRHGFLGSNTISFSEGRYGQDTLHLWFSVYASSQTPKLLKCKYLKVH